MKSPLVMYVAFLVFALCCLTAASSEGQSLCWVCSSCNLCYDNLNGLGQVHCAEVTAGGPCQYNSCTPYGGGCPPPPCSGCGGDDGGDGGGGGGGGGGGIDCWDPCGDWLCGGCENPEIPQHGWGHVGAIAGELPPMLLTAVLVQLPSAKSGVQVREQLVGGEDEVSGFGTTPILSAISKVAGVPASNLRLAATAHVIGDPSHAEGIILPTGEGLGFAGWYDGSKFLIRTAGYDHHGVVRNQSSVFPGTLHISEIWFAGNAYVLAVKPLVFSNDEAGAGALHEALLASRADVLAYDGERTASPARLASRSELVTLATRATPATWGHVKMIYR